jgi:hypothetical protein
MEKTLTVLNGYKEEMPGAEAHAGERLVILSGCTKIARQAYAGREDIKKVTIAEGVETIGNAAFICCKNLADIEFPNSVRRIEPLAFHGTPWFDNQPDGMVYAGRVAYEYKGEMPEGAAIVLREGTTAIAEQAFIDPNIASVTYIGAGQFENCNEVFKERVTIRCHENTLAHTYAVANGIRIELL